jgi:hypothetical protein
MWVIIPKPDHRNEFFAALKEHMAFRAEQGDPRQWQGYTPLLGDNLNRVAVRACCFSWADQDAYEDWNRNHPAVSEHFDQHVGPHAADYHHYFERLDWANSHWSESAGPYRLFAVTEFNIKAGHAAEFDMLRDKMSQIAIQQGWASDNHVWLWSTTIGGGQQEAIIVPHADFASFDRDEMSFAQFLADKLGSAEAAGEMMREFANTTESTDFQIWVHEQNLSMGSGD